MPADGFYEWQKTGGKSRPYLLRRPDRGVFAFAALHETWSSPDGSEIDTVALLNTTANGVIAAIHERSPVILPRESFDTWLDPLTPPDDAERLLRPPPDDLLEMVEIGTAINKVANDGPSVQEPPGPLLASPEKPAARAAATRPGKAGGEQGSLF
jgi:putative SOS response-associated peptidase YedK